MTDEQSGPKKSRNVSVEAPSVQPVQPAPEQRYVSNSVTATRLWRRPRNGYYLIEVDGDQRYILQADLPENNQISKDVFTQLEIPRWVTAQLPPEEE